MSSHRRRFPQARCVRQPRRPDMRAQAWHAASPKARAGRCAARATRCVPGQRIMAVCNLLRSLGRGSSAYGKARVRRCWANWSIARALIHPERACGMARASNSNARAPCDHSQSMCEPSRALSRLECDHWASGVRHTSFENSGLRLTHSVQHSLNQFYCKDPARALTRDDLWDSNHS